MYASRALVQVAVLIAWILPAPAFIRGRATSAKPVKSRDSFSRLGMFIQGAAFALSWMGPWWMFAPRSPAMNPALALVAVGVSFAGSFLVISSIRTLGKQWSLTARIT